MPVPDNKHFGKQPHACTAGFTLLEVLAALALCVLLASVTASATLLSTRAARHAVRLQDQALRLRSLHAQARLRPASLSDTDSPSSPWRIAVEERIESAPAPTRHASRLSESPAAPLSPRRWTLLTLRTADGTLRPVRLAVLESTP